MTKFTSVSLLFFLCCIIQSVAQTPRLPAKVKVGKPEVLKPRNGICKLDDLKRELSLVNKWGTKKTVNEFWIVRSDRSNNQIYADAYMLKKLNTTLAFNQQVVICEVKGNMALVYEDNRLEQFPYIPNYAKCMGWVPMENLLLWDTCPATQRGVQCKALLGINLNRIGWGKDFKGMVYKDPVTNEGAQNMTADLKLYFVMKESGDGKRALLCENPILFGNNLYGWVDENALSRWDQRVCLEPNWNPQYVESHRGQEVDIYTDRLMNSDDKVASWIYGKSNGDQDAIFQYRMAPSQLRFPVIEKADEKVNRTRCIFFMGKTDKTYFEDEMSDVTEEAKSIQQMRGQMNLILVIEATTEMRKILPAIKKSLAKCKNLNDIGLQVKAGLVLYRGAKQGVRGLETVPLTSCDAPMLLSKLVSSKANGRLSSKESDVALTLAIEKATDASKMGFQKNQKNLLIVIGNRGAPKTDPSLPPPEMLNRLYDNNIQMMSIQVTKNQTGSLANFNDQMVGLIKANIDKLYEEIGYKADIIQREQGDGYDFDATFKENVYFAAIRHSSKEGKSLGAEDVTEYIDDGINGFVEAGSKWDRFFGESIGVIQFDPAYLKKYLGTAALENWKQNRFVSLFDGYVPLKDKDGNDYWHYVVFLCGDELLRLLDDLKPTYEVVTKRSDDRKPYIDAIRTLVKAYLGQVKDKDIDNMDENQFQELIYGIDVHAEMRNPKKLKDMANPQVVSDMEYQKILGKFRDNYEKLLGLHTDGYTYRTKIGKDWYYWIPIEYLP